MDIVKVIIVNIILNKIEWKICIVQQYDGHIYHPQTYQDYFDMKVDDKIINYCQFLMYKFAAHVILVTSDNNMIANAVTKGISRVWNPSKKNSLSDFLTIHGLTSISKK